MIILYLAFLFFLLIISYCTYINLINKKLNILIDQPNTIRKLHKKGIPTGGGILFSIIGFIFGIILNLKIFIISFPLTCIGFMDDIFKLSAKKRFFVQLIVGLVLLLNSNFLKIIFSNFSLITAIFLIIFFLICITGSINLTNFMDGLDGLVSGSFSVIFIYLSFFKNIHYLPFAIALIAFLIFNWPPAKLFMGDAGSTYLGAVFIGICICQESFREGIEIFLLASPLYADSTFTLVFRFFKERSKIFKPHKKHLYQRLYEYGFSKSQISSFFVFAIILNALSLEIFGMIGLTISTILEILLGLYFNERIKRKIDFIR